MNPIRIASAGLEIFKTFDGYRRPEFLDLDCESSSLKRLEDLPNLGLAIVGTRHPQKRSIEFLEEVFRDLQGSRLVIISGFARGIDCKAHELALKYGLRTIAILGCGIDVDYPKEHRRIREKIRESGGIILSQFEKGASPLPRHFYERNGLIAGFANAVWVVEAAAVSGTLNTANWAMRFNRDLYATSSFPRDPFFQGNEKLLSQKSPEKYPLANAFFGAHSLSSTWPEINHHSQQLDFKSQIEQTKTETQKWVLSIKSDLGQCQTQVLLQFATQKGVSPGQFYLQLEQEIAAGFLRQEADGRIEVIL